MPLLARLLPAPVAVEVRHGAIAGLGALLATAGSRPRAGSLSR
jgi:hypothetical protein